MLSDDSLAKALYDEFGMNLNPSNPERYWRFAADGIRSRWINAHDASVRADQIEKDAALAEKVADESPYGFQDHSNEIVAAIRAQLNEGTDHE